MTVRPEPLELISLPEDPAEALREILASPDFDPRFLEPVIHVDRWDPVFGWGCIVPDCAVARYTEKKLCTQHAEEYRVAHEATPELTTAEWARSASPRRTRMDTSLSGVRCTICPDRPAASASSGWPLCSSHVTTWGQARNRGEDFAQWRARQQPHPGHGTCRVACCDSVASVSARDRTHVALCNGHHVAMRKVFTTPLGEIGDDEFRDFCLRTPPLRDARSIDMRGLRPLVELELRFVLWRKSTGKHGILLPSHATYLVNAARAQQVERLQDLDVDCSPPGDLNKYGRHLHTAGLKFLRHWLTPAAEEWEKDVIDLRILGYDFGEARTLSLEQVRQPWLKELLRSWLRWRVKDPKLRSTGPLENAVGGITELSLFLHAHRGDQGMAPYDLRLNDIEDWVEDLNKRVIHGRTFRRKRRDGRKQVHSKVTKSARYITLMGARKVLEKAHSRAGWAKGVGLPHDFVIEHVPSLPSRKRPRPFDDTVARVLGNPEKIALLEKLDRADSGAGDIWATEVCTGRRISEVLELGLDCYQLLDGRYWLWHDQTKVGQLDEGVPIPKWIFERLTVRTAKTIARFVKVHNREPTAQERLQMKLFASPRKDRWLRSAGTHNWFNQLFRQWLEMLELPGLKTHQARHTLATALYKHGASLEQIRKFLGHCSQAMAEYYVEIANDDVHVILQQLWVWGPGHPQAGQTRDALRSAVTTEDAAAILKDLVEVGTRVPSGLCLNHVVLFEKKCPFALDCDNCGDLVVPLGDLPWWRQRRDQMYALAEQAPTVEAADYIRESFRPYLDVIAGLEAMVEALGLTDAVNAVTPRAPNFFGDFWRMGVAASDVVKLVTTSDDGSAA